MQIIINIPEDFIDTMNSIEDDRELSQAQLLTVYRGFHSLLQHGIQLPKGHGKLIDANKFLKDNEAYTGWILNSSDWGGENAYKDTLEDLVNEAPTVVEADTEE